MPDRRPIGYRNVYKQAKSIQKYMYVFKYICFKISIGLRKHVGLQRVFTGISVSDGACWCPIGQVSFQWDISVSNGLQSSLSVSDGHVEF